MDKQKGRRLKCDLVSHKVSALSCTICFMRLIYFLLNLSQLLVLKPLTHFLPRGWNATPHNPTVYSFPIRNSHVGTHAVQSLRLDLRNQMACLNPAQHFKNRPRKLGSSRGSELCIIRFQGSEKTFSLSAG